MHWKHALPLAVIVAAAALPATAGRGTVIPVLWQAPTCGYDKLGQVSIQTGTRVSGTTRDTMLPTVDYALALAQLAAAAQAAGGNAVIVRWHKATYFTRNGRRSRRPVYVQLRGAVIHARGDARQCGFSIADRVGFEERAVGGEPVEVSSGEAYAD